jgi:YbgC/YbaW family acyl-CoA thioester hydrolase
MNYFYLTYRVPFSEVDAMNMVHHSNHARYLERGRIDLLRQIGMDYERLMQTEQHFPLTAMDSQFKRPLRFNDILLIETRIQRLTRVRLNFSYKIFTTNSLAEVAPTNSGLDTRPLVTALTEHCCVNNQGKPVEMTDLLYDTLSRHFVLKEIA